MSFLFHGCWPLIILVGSLYLLELTVLTGTERLVCELTRSDSEPWHQWELLVVFTMLADRQGVPIALTQFCPCSNSLYIYIYRMSINRTKTRSNFKSSIVQWLSHWPLKLWIVRLSPAMNIFLRIKLYFYLVFPFYFSQFWSKTMCEYILKVRQYWICNGIEAKLFYFSKWLIHKGKTWHIAWL